MRLNKIFLLVAVFTGIITSCKEELDVKTNEPAINSVKNESDIIALAKGGTYVNGFKDLKYTDGVMGAFWGTGYHDLMADVVSAEAANVYINQIGCPETATLDDGTVVPNPSNPAHQPSLLRQVNLNSNAGQNPLFYEWGYMYALNNVQNNLLALVDGIAYTGDAETKANVVKAWAYWWKGFAYFRIGSIYYAGIINDEPGKTNGEYKTYVQVLAEAENNWAKAETILKATAGNADYIATLGAIIPEYFQIGHGGVLTPEMWIRNINTMRARSILANNRVKDMTAAQWDQVLALTNAGIQEADFVFTGRSNGNADIFSANSGMLSAKTTGDPKAGATYKITERLIQDFQAGDKRLGKNFKQITAWIGESSRGNAFNTRWELLDGGFTPEEGEDDPYEGAFVYSDRDEGATELFMAGSYDENELMKAEAMIHKGNIAGGLALVDAIRDYQGAGLAPSVAATEADALEQVRSERRVGLLFRSVAFYDARRWGVIDPVASGGGRKNAVVISKAGVVSTNATLDFQYLDYWDVPDNELKYNAPTDGSAPVVNPKN